MIFQRQSRESFIVRYSKRPGGYVYLDGEKFNIEAKVHTLSGYSAHADRKGLLEWVASMPEKPGRIKLVHGEPGAQKALYKAMLAAEERFNKIYQMDRVSTEIMGVYEAVLNNMECI